MQTVSYYTLSLWLLCSSCAVTSYVHPFAPKHSWARNVPTKYHSALDDSPSTIRLLMILDEEESAPISDSDNNENVKQIDANNDADVTLEGFQIARKRREEELQKEQTKVQEVDGYFLRDAIYAKWGFCYDVDFNRVDVFGLRELYLNVLPFHLGGRRFRHETELDYLCHLQAVVEILEKYEQLDYVLAQIKDTKKKPRPGTVPIIAVPLRLDLTPKQVQEIIGY